VLRGLPPVMHWNVRWEILQITDKVNRYLKPTDYFESAVIDVSESLGTSDYAEEEEEEAKAVKNSEDSKEETETAEESTE
jgi:hypothetical protein